MTYSSAHMCKMPASISQISSQYASPASVDCPNWPLIDEELATMLCPLHFELVNEIIIPSIAAEEATTLVNAYLHHHGVLMKPSTRSVPPAVPTNDYNHERAIVRLMKRLSRLKNNPGVLSRVAIPPSS